MLGCHHRGWSVVLQPFSLPYSAKCVEGEFSEVELPLYGVFRSSTGIHRALLACVRRRTLQEVGSRCNRYWNSL
jgi:hypothetical protein